MHKGLFQLGNQESEQLIARIKDVSKIILYPPVEVATDTSNYMKMDRGQVIRLGDRDFLLRGNVYEPRFGMQEQPKFWVKLCNDLNNGQLVIIKFEFHEEFVATIGKLHIPCYRSPEKEGQVLELVKDDERFMHGEAIVDDSGNLVRVLEFISGNTLYGDIYDMKISHEEYYYKRLNPILKRLIDSFEAIQMLHDNGFCHGDIRNDHIVIDERTGKYRWIDFDLCQDFLGYDVCAIGNILQYVIGKGLNSYYEINKGGRFPASTISSLDKSDANAFYTYRIMNLKKLYPYISEQLSTILLRFSVGATENYATVSRIIQDLSEAIDEVPTN